MGGNYIVLRHTEHIKTIQTQVLDPTAVSLLCTKAPRERGAFWLSRTPQVGKGSKQRLHVEIHLFLITFSIGLPKTRLGPA